MGTLVAVKKNGRLAIGADSFSLMERVMQSALNQSSHGRDHGCIIKCGESYLGLNATLAFQQNFETAMEALGNSGAPLLGNVSQIRQFFTGVHNFMKANFGLAPVFQQGQPFEVTPMNALIINNSGIFKVDSNRAVYEFSEYWAIGSSEMVALGALEALYDGELDASEIARRALQVTCTFETLPEADIYIREVHASNLHLARSPARQSKRVVHLSDLPKGPGGSGRGKRKPPSRPRR